MTSAVEYPGVVTTSNCAEGGSHSLSAGIFVTVAVVPDRRASGDGEIRGSAVSDAGESAVLGGEDCAR